MKKILTITGCIAAAALCLTAVLWNRADKADVQKIQPDVIDAEAAVQLSDSDKLEQAKANGLTQYAEYNPDRDEFYDSRYLKWDAEQQRYLDVSPEVHFDPEQIAAEPDCEIPEALQAALDEFSAAMDIYKEENPSFAIRSDYYFLDDTEALRKLKNETAVPFFDTYLAMAKGRYPYYKVLGSYMVHYVLQYDPSVLPDDFSISDAILKEADEAVRTKGSGITAADCAELQSHYGYLIAPALQEIGKTELLQIDPDSPCQDPEQLANLACTLA